MSDDIIVKKFNLFAKWSSSIAGHPFTFAFASIIVILWAISGPIFNFSDTWQLVINTSTTVITFLIVFLIQNTQNRDMEAIQIKLDELIRSIDKAHNAVLDIEELDEKQLDRIRENYEQLAKKARENRQKTNNTQNESADDKSSSG